MSTFNRESITISESLTRYFEVSTELEVLYLEEREGIDLEIAEAKMMVDYWADQISSIRKCSCWLRSGLCKCTQL